MMIYIRDDDVLIDSSGHTDSFKRFIEVHEMICDVEGVLHVPAILVHNVIKDDTRGIVGFPGAVEFVREETAAGRMRPEVHGWEHIDYAKLSFAEIVEHLRRCKDFIHTNFNREPEIWYTPWGANKQHLHDAAEQENLKLVDCTQINKLSGRFGVVQQLRDGKNAFELFNEKEIFFHWWEHGNRLRRVLECLKHEGSWEQAKKVNKELFDG